MHQACPFETMKLSTANIGAFDLEPQNLTIGIIS